MKKQNKTKTSWGRTLKLRIEGYNMSYKRRFKIKGAACEKVGGFLVGLT